MKPLKQLEEQKAKIEEQIQQLKNKVEFRKFKCLPNLEVSKIKDHKETFDKIVIPKGCRLMRIWEFAKLIESDESDEFLGDYKGKDCYFFLEQTKYAKAKGYNTRAYLGRNGGWGSNCDVLAGSSDDGRVVFVKELKK